MVLEAWMREIKWFSSEEKPRTIEEDDVFTGLILRVFFFFGW